MQIATTTVFTQHTLPQALAVLTAVFTELHESSREISDIIRLGGRVLSAGRFLIIFKLGGRFISVGRVLIIFKLGRRVLIVHTLPRNIFVVIHSTNSAEYILIPLLR